MGNIDFSIISNPPYGKTVNPDVKDILYYKGSEFEYKTIELGAVLGASDGVFLIPQESCPFKMSKVNYTRILKPEEYSSKYKKFIKESGLEIYSNNGFTTEICEDENGWKDISITTEIAILEYEESDYKPKYPILEKEKIEIQTEINFFE